MSDIVEGKFELVETAVAGELQTTFLPSVARPGVADDYERIVDYFLADLDVSQNSRATYRRQLYQSPESRKANGASSAFFVWLESRRTRIDQVRPRDVVAYRDYLQNAGLSVYSVNAYLTAVRRFFSWFEDVAGEHGNANYRSPAAKIKGLRKPRSHARDAFTRDQLRTIADTIAPDGDGSVERLRNFAMFEIATRCALRTVELSRATYGDLRQKDGARVLYVQGKGRASADEFVKLTPKTWSAVKAYLDARPDKLTANAPLFASLSRKNKGQAMTPRAVSRILKTAINAAGIDARTLTPHSLRHSAVTIAIENGAAIQDVQAMARHRSLETTQIYWHNRRRLENAAEDLIDY